MLDPNDDAKKDAGNGHAPMTVAFDYIKSQDFKVIRADGAIGGVTPSGHIHMALYSERQAIPRRIVNELNADGTLGAVLDDKTETRGSMVREMDIDVFLTRDVAKNIGDWLLERVKETGATQTFPGEEKL